MGDVGHVYIQIRSGSCMIDWGSLQYVLCDMEEICVKHTDNCKTVIFDKDILSSYGFLRRPSTKKHKKRGRSNLFQGI